MVFEHLFNDCWVVWVVFEGLGVFQGGFGWSLCLFTVLVVLNGVLSGFEWCLIGFNGFLEVVEWFLKGC